MYGLPAYNLKQEEYSFALGSNYESKNGIAAISDSGIEKDKGIDHYYHKESVSPFAYSYMLTAILSPDYVDKTGDGISNDDNGTAIKFSYSKVANYKWRTPYKNKLNGSTLRNTAAVNRGLLADPDDDKGNIVYGAKEIYYINKIESKTKVAYFITEDRKDGLGVVDLNGEPDLGARQKRLIEIRLYSKQNLSIPIKVVKFDYSYELCPGTPNSIAEPVSGAAQGQGKLTLKRVWFEYGQTHKGAEHPYVFNYNKDLNGTPVYYGSQQTDRWGVYKNPSTNPGGLTNEEYPYSDQNKANSDLAVSLWQLKSIEIPSGGTIEINYEADDYAYVQNKQATTMVPFSVLGTVNSLIGSPGISVPVDLIPPSGTDETVWFKKNYLNGSDYIYTKSFVKVSNGNAASGGKDNEFIPSYCKVSKVKIVGGRAEITFENINEAGLSMNPIRFAAWQRIKNEYPRYAYPGFQNRVTESSSGLENAVRAVMNAAKNLTELKENFYQKADRKKYAAEIDESKSMAKIVKTTGFKQGGGLRVKKITIADNWDDLSGSNAPKGVYGQSYDYTTMDNNRKISSGVASYEPSVGNDENALKSPVPYVQKIKGAINNFFELEEPYGESFYPSPSVVYSKVTVRDLQAGGAEVLFPKTGFIVNELYTAKDFPVKVNVSPMSRYNPKPSNTYSFIKTKSIEEMVLSQGYNIELNDMHGKPKANRIFNQAGAEISSTEYIYKVDDLNAPELRLNNRVKVAYPSGKIEDKILGRNIEFFTDFREQETNNTGQAINFGLDIIPAFWFPIPIPHWPSNVNDEYKLFRSACAVKVIQSSGLISKVIKKENGSSIAVENVIYDSVTGEAIVTKTQNEFKQDYYSLNMPAYWVYKAMGGAYENLGVILKNMSLNSMFAVTPAYWSILKEGDEVINLQNNTQYWVTVDRAPSAEYGAKILIDRTGQQLKQIAAKSDFKIIRSGNRNLNTAVSATITSINYPVKNNRLILASTDELSAYKIINASATTYDDEWPVDATGQVNRRIEASSGTFTFVKSINHNDHGKQGGRYYNPCGSPNCNPYVPFANEYLRKRMDQIGVWINADYDNNVDIPIGFETTFYVNESKTYYIGFGGDDRLSINVDGNDHSFPESYNNFEFWQIHPIYLLAGVHTIRATGVNVRQVYTTIGQNPGSIAIEIYNNSFNEVLSASGDGSLNKVFSTASLINNPDLQVFKFYNGRYYYRFSYESSYNPFVHGIKGNWRASGQLVYQENRDYSGTGKGMDLKNAGYLKTFKSYWANIDLPGWSFNPNPNGNKWTMTNAITLYDKYGQELENKDALGRFSSARFDFNGQLPAAVASNAMNREIYVNSFEDLDRLAASPDTLVNKEFIVVASTFPLKWFTSMSKSHSGNYSLELPQSGIQLSSIKHGLEHKTYPYLNRNGSGVILSPQPGTYPRGFEPRIDSSYVFNVWVKDNQPKNKTINITVIQQGTNNTSPVELKCKAIVEGWKLLEGVFNTSSVPGNKWGILIAANSPGIAIDDIRIHPYAAHVKSYAYNNMTYKLMAELDENAFATFYEYDEEGSLIRVKKETERGIATIKENRSSYRKWISK